MNDELEKTESSESTEANADSRNAVSVAPAPAIGSARPSGGLPGLGGKPGGGLPGLGGKPGGGLPGLGAQPGGGLPGMGGVPAGIPPVAAGAPVPTFIQKQQEQARQEAMARDPFAAGNLPAQRSSFVPAGQGDIEASGSLTGVEGLSKSRMPMIIFGLVVGVVFFGLGYGAGLAVNTRGMLNKVLRDAWIIQYEMNRLRTLHGEVQGMVGTALADAQQKKFHKGHVDFLAEKVSGNPFDAKLFTDRNFNSLNPLVVQMMAGLFRNWEALSSQIAEHRQATNNDEKPLSAAGEEFQKLLTTNYGVIFGRNEQADGALEANLVVLGAMDGKDVQIQLKPGTYGEEKRELYNPEGADDRLTKEPEKYVVVVGQQSKQSLLQNATQSHFTEYLKRLEDMATLLKVMEEQQNNMFGPLDDNCSREPVSFLARGVDPEAEFQEYKAKVESAAPAAE